MEENKKPEFGRKISIDPNILLDCVEYVNGVTDGYVSIYQNFQKILWTLRKRGVSEADAAVATVEIVNRASAKARAMVPHKNPFEKLEEDKTDEKEGEDDDKKEEATDEDTQS